jgi:DNA modification methylase
MLDLNKIYNFDAFRGLKLLDDNSIDCCVTSPPYYGLRDYGVAGQTGLEHTPEEYIEKLVAVFMEVRRILNPVGTLWIVIGDSYAGSGRGIGDINRNGIQPAASYDGEFLNPYKSDTCKSKDLIGIPWLLAFALRNAGWYLRQEIIWAKTNPMPESVKDRCTKSHESIFLFSKSKHYYFDYKSIQEPCIQGDNRIRDRDNTRLNNTPGRTRMAGLTRNDYEYRNKRDVWGVSTKSEKESHFAVFPEKLIVDCIKAGCPENGIVLDPFMGSGTTAIVARKMNRNYVGFELHPKYIKIAERKLNRELGMWL